MVLVAENRGADRYSLYSTPKDSPPAYRQMTTLPSEIVTGIGFPPLMAPRSAITTEG
jgi:hypothetical protein